MTDYNHLLGQTVGRYRILSFVGEGGMAQVFIGVEPAVGRRVAIKILLEELCRRPDVVERFINEAKAMGRIAHPGVADVFDIERLPSGRVCIIMELLAGQPLRDVLTARAMLPPGEVAHAIAEIADAMAAAHHERIVHRDLKPDNIFVVPDPGGPPRYKVLDFGIAKVMDASNVHTATSATLGTAAYMAPEQFRSSRDVDHRADVYALGCMAFEMLTGRLPFDGRNLVEQMRAHLEQPMPPLPTYVPPPLSALVGRMLVKERDQRIGSMPEVAAAARAAVPTARPTATSSSHAGAAGGLAAATWVAIALLAIVAVGILAIALLS